MRRALVALSTLALVACQVDLEGARCDAPGTAEQCPDGQECGNDRRCTQRAAACVTRCDVGVRRCAGAGARELVEECTDHDPICGVWVAESCTARGLECGERGPAPACECPPSFAGPEFAADPVTGSPDPDAPPFPTGAASPPECRFRRLGHALAAADRLGSPAVVQTHGAAGEQVVFGDAASADGFPLAVAANVTLRGAPSPAGETIVRAQAVTASELLTVQGRVEALRVESVSSNGTGVFVSCGTFGKPSLDAVSVDGGNVLVRGIDVAAGACGAELSRVDVFNVAGIALRTAGDPETVISVTGSKLRDSTVGVRATGGTLTLGVDGDPLSAVEVRDNSGDGIVLVGGSPATHASLFRALVARNKGTGMVVDVVNSTSKLTVRGCDVHENGGISPRAYGPGSPQRKAGGVLIRQGALANFVFEGNRVFGNATDQLAFESTVGATWSISPNECGAASNAFGCIPDGSAGVSITGGSVDASYSVWPDPYWNQHVNGTVVSTAYCNGLPGTPPLPATCPAP